MAYIKKCDACGKEMELPGETIIQIHGSVSEQKTDEHGRIDYRYLTPHPNAKLAFHEVGCMQVWIADMQENIPFQPRWKKARGYPHQ